MKVEIIGINGELVLPREHFTHIEHQLDSTPGDNLIEVAGRVCYDSFDQKKSRSSQDYHAHIQEVGHHSVTGHGSVTIVIGNERQAKDFAWQYRDEPGWCIAPGTADEYFYVSANIRFLNRVCRSTTIDLARSSQIIDLLVAKAVSLYPMSMNVTTSGNAIFYPHVETDHMIKTLKTQNHYFITMLLEMSRSCSAEWNRHLFESALSQESTRYVEIKDIGSDIYHPFLRRVEDTNVYDKIKEIIDLYRSDSLIAYQEVYEILNTFLCDVFPSEKLANKKIARGAAARLLPMGVKTKQVYTASLRQWKEIFAQRITESADLEIRLLAQKAYDEIMISPHVCESAKEFMTGEGGHINDDR